MTKLNARYDNMVRMRPSPTICATAIRVRLDSRTLGDLEVLRSSPAIEMSPMLILSPATYFHRFGGRRNEIGYDEPSGKKRAKSPSQEELSFLRAGGALP